MEVVAPCFACSANSLSDSRVLNDCALSCRCSYGYASMLPYPDSHGWAFNRPNPKRRYRLYRELRPHHAPCLYPHHALSLPLCRWDRSIRRHPDADEAYLLPCRTASTTRYCRSMVNRLSQTIACLSPRKPNANKLFLLVAFALAPDCTHDYVPQEVYAL